MGALVRLEDEPHADELLDLDLYPEQAGDEARAGARRDLACGRDQAGEGDLREVRHRVEIAEDVASRAR